jgi:hypothetical protein
LTVAKNDSEALFFEMLRALALAIGWAFSAVFMLLGLLFDGLASHIRNSKQQKQLRALTAPPLRWKHKRPPSSKKRLSPP